MNSPGRIDRPMPRVSRTLVALGLTAIVWFAPAPIVDGAHGALLAAASGSASTGDRLHIPSSFDPKSGRTRTTLKSAGTVLPTAQGAEQVVVRDVDRDGYGDLLALSADGDMPLWRNDGRARFVQASGRRPSLRLACAPHALSRASAARPSIDTSIDSPAVVTVGAARIGPVQVRAGPAADRPRRLPKPALPSFGPPRAPPLRIV